MLIVLGGLPGTGKSTIARALAVRQRAAYLRIDAIEHALRGAGQDACQIGPAGYLVAYALAESHLAIGIPVVADCVNPLAVTRQSWRDVAHRAGSALWELEIVCSDAVEHRRRVETRAPDLQGFVLPTWESILRHDYTPWTTERLVIDTAQLSAAAAVDAILFACGTAAP